LQEYARAARRLIAEFRERPPRGWIIDLRLNGGGTVWPMLLGLQPLLGNGPQMTSVNNGMITATFGLSGKEAWIDGGGQKLISLRMADDDALPEPVNAQSSTNALQPPHVAVLLGPWTMSSGESLAIALRGSVKNARTFGEPTAGLTTVTQMYTLSDGSTLILPVALMADKDGHAVHGAITPDELVSFNDWPTDDDAVVKAARKWMNAN
jgi:C-terminal processing protease CtpA/Prc